jgi:hypothetical protein
LGRISKVDLITNVRNLPLMRLALMSFLVLVPYSACAQISSGTVIVFGISRDKVIVAGDSRGLIAGEAPNDHMCKIVALGTRLIFTQAGVTEDIHTVAVSKNWSAAKEASRAFDTFQKSNAKADPIDQVSGDWLVSMKKIYSRLLRTNRQEILDRDGDTLIASVFVGLDIGGHIKARQIIISFDRAAEQSGTPKLIVDNQLLEITDQNTFHLTGHGEVAYEFWVQSSTRAKIDWQGWQLELGKHLGEDADVLNAVHLVDVSESYAPADWGIGGAIDVAEIFPNTGVHWIHRKPECPAQGVN